MTTPARADQDLADAARHVALLLLREIPRAAQANRHHLIAPLLGDCIRLATGGHDGHPALRPIAASIPAAAT